MADRDVGKCHRCGLPVPMLAMDGEIARDGVEHKAIWGKPIRTELYHYEDPRFENCWEKEKRDPRSDWWNGHFLDRDDEPFLSVPAEVADHDNI